MNKHKENKWYKYTYEKWNRQILPPAKKEVLLFFPAYDNFSQAYCVGYLKYAAGDLASPEFIHPGVDRGIVGKLQQPTAWNDCLPQGTIDWVNHQKDFSDVT